MLVRNNTPSPAPPSSLGSSSLSSREFGCSTTTMSEVDRINPASITHANKSGNGQIRHDATHASSPSPRVMYRAISANESYVDITCDHPSLLLRTESPIGGIIGDSPRVRMREIARNNQGRASPLARHQHVHTMPSPQQQYSHDRLATPPTQHRYASPNHTNTSRGVGFGASPKLISRSLASPAAFGVTRVGLDSLRVGGVNECPAAAASSPEKGSPPEESHNNNTNTILLPPSSQSLQHTIVLPPSASTLDQWNATDRFTFLPSVDAYFETFIPSGKPSATVSFASPDSGVSSSSPLSLPSFTGMIPSALPIPFSSSSSSSFTAASKRTQTAPDWPQLYAMEEEERNTLEAADRERRSDVNEQHTQADDPNANDSDPNLTIDGDDTTIDTEEEQGAILNFDRLTQHTGYYDDDDEEHHQNGGDDVEGDADADDDQIDDEHDPSCVLPPAYDSFRIPSALDVFTSSPSSSPVELPDGLSASDFCSSLVSLPPALGTFLPASFNLIPPPSVGLLTTPRLDSAAQKECFVPVLPPLYTSPTVETRPLNTWTTNHQADDQQEELWSQRRQPTESAHRAELILASAIHAPECDVPDTLEYEDVSQPQPSPQPASVPNSPPKNRHLGDDDDGANEGYDPFTSNQLALLTACLPPLLSAVDLVPLSTLSDMFSAAVLSHPSHAGACRDLFDEVSKAHRILDLHRKDSSNLARIGREKVEAKLSELSRLKHAREELRNKIAKMEHRNNQQGDDEGSGAPICVEGPEENSDATGASDPTTYHQPPSASPPSGRTSSRLSSRRTPGPTTPQQHDASHQHALGVGESPLSIRLPTPWSSPPRILSVVVSTRPDDRLENPRPRPHWNHSLTDSTSSYTPSGSSSSVTHHSHSSHLQHFSDLSSRSSCHSDESQIRSTTYSRTTSNGIGSDEYDQTSSPANRVGTAPHQSSPFRIPALPMPASTIFEFKLQQNEEDENDNNQTIRSHESRHTTCDTHGQPQPHPHPPPPPVPLTHQKELNWSTLLLPSAPSFDLCRHGSEVPRG